MRRCASIRSPQAATKCGATLAYGFDPARRRSWADPGAASAFVHGPAQPRTARPWVSREAAAVLELDELQPDTGRTHERGVNNIRDPLGRLNADLIAGARSARRGRQG